MFFCFHHYFSFSSLISRLKSSQGISRHLKAFQGVSRRLKASHGVSRRLKSSQGISRPLKEFKASQRVSKRFTETHWDSYILISWSRTSKGFWILFRQNIWPALMFLNHDSMVPRWFHEKSSQSLLLSHTIWWFHVIFSHQLPLHFGMAATTSTFWTLATIFVCQNT